MLRNGDGSGKKEYIPKTIEMFTNSTIQIVTYFNMNFRFMQFDENKSSSDKNLSDF